MLYLAEFSCYFACKETPQNSRELGNAEYSLRQLLRVSGDSVTSFTALSYTKLKKKD